MIRGWYISADKQACILTKWRSVFPTDEKAHSPERSKVKVFQNFLVKLMSLQKHLDTTYHDNTYLGDRFLTAVNIPSVQASLSVHMPRISHQVVNRVASRLSDKQLTLGSASALCTAQTVCTNDDDEMYSLGRSCGEAAVTPVKLYGSRGLSVTREDRKRF